MNIYKNIYLPVITCSYNQFKKKNFFGAIGKKILICSLNLNKNFNIIILKSIKIKINIIYTKYLIDVYLLRKWFCIFLNI